MRAFQVTARCAIFHVRATAQGGSPDPVPHHAGPAGASAEENMGFHALRIEHQRGGEGELRFTGHLCLY